MQTLLSDLDKTHSLILDSRSDIFSRLDSLLDDLTSAKSKIQRECDTSVS